MTSYASDGHDLPRYAPYANLTSHQRDGGEALRSALGRLPMAIIVADDTRTLLPLNRCAEHLFDNEALQPDLLESYRAHPIARLIRAVDRTGDPELGPGQTIAFPSGSRYRVRVSTPSENGCKGWLLLLIEPAGADRPMDEHGILEDWALTPRERDVARHLLRGASSDEICRAAGIASNTLRTHVRRILEKTGMHSRAEFVAKALGHRAAGRSV